ncbi:high mobility group box domain-containing protein [Dichotomocladium elegans]|nr:high mobility group box domain-containing protein [Dichotomocladium elegans]
MGDDPSKRLQRKANDQKPERLKRPPNAYLLFNRDMRHKILHKNANLSVAEISKLISERWNELSLEGKEHYNREAAKLKQEHMDNHPNFIYSRRSKAELAEAGYKSRPAKKRKITLSPKPLAEPKGRDPRGRKKKRLKNPTAPKHPMSGFLFYSTSVRAEIAASMQKASVGDISKVIASRWRRMSANERAPWNRKAEEDKARYAREMEDFTSSLEDEAQETQGRTNGGRAEGPRSPVELDSQTIATVAQMVNPVIRQSDMVLPPSCSHTRQYQILPATPPHSGN